MGVCASLEDADAQLEDDDLWSPTKSPRPQKRASDPEFHQAVSHCAEQIGGTCGPKCAGRSSEELIRRGLVESKEILMQCLGEMMDHTRNGVVTKSQWTRMQVMLAQVGKGSIGDLAVGLVAAVADKSEDEMETAAMEDLHLEHMFGALLAAGGTVAHVLLDLVPSLTAQPVLRAEVKSKLEPVCKAETRTQAAKALGQVIWSGVEDKGWWEFWRALSDLMKTELPSKLEEVVMDVVISIVSTCDAVVIKSSKISEGKLDRSQLKTCIQPLVHTIIDAISQLPPVLVYYLKNLPPDGPAGVLVRAVAAQPSAFELLWKLTAAELLRRETQLCDMYVRFFVTTTDRLSPEVLQAAVRIWEPADHEHARLELILAMFPDKTELNENLVLKLLDSSVQLAIGVSHVIAECLSNVLCQHMTQPLAQAYIELFSQVPKPDCSFVCQLRERGLNLDGERWEAQGAPVSYTHLRAHETPEHLVCRLLLEKKKTNNYLLHIPSVSQINASL
eukprot:TRINITY_DN16102_c0_g1_i2.p1 TRINITY_DN16102_c0_g1~~TRINITY_DN16102_c0_g1_i2.p1  ORF type:complete len:503 (-),score=89.78 TRINITY_DN16102_c0_g1_i2:10-1518(-)